MKEKIKLKIKKIIITEEVITIIIEIIEDLIIEIIIIRKIIKVKMQ
jgi:hypothetical protein